MNTKLLFTILLSIFLIGTVSAFDFDNVKDYDARSKTATFTNIFGMGDKIADVRLDAVPVYNEEFGTEVYLAVVGKESKFAEFTVIPNTDYSDILKEVSFYDIRTSKYITKPVIAKVKSLELVNKDIYDDVCNFELNGTLTCSRQVVGTEKVEEEVYLPLEKVDITSGKEVTIALYTEIKNGDYFDYVPKFFGQDVTEWAIVASDNQLMTYLSFDDNSGVIANNSKNLNLFNATLDNANQWNATNKKIGASALQVRDVASQMARIKANVILTSSPTAGFTISTWAYRLQAGADNKVFGQQTGGFFMGWNSGSDQFTATYRGGSAVTAPANTTINVWELWTVTVSNTNWTIYKNGYPEATGTVATYSGSGALRIGNIDNSDTDASMFNGTLDEVAIWNRSLSSSEVVDLWAGGSGYNPFANTLINISVTLLSPANNTFTTNTSLILNASLTPSNSNLTNATFYVWYPNATLFNKTTNIVLGNSTNYSSLNIFNLTLGGKLWNVLACGTNTTGQNTTCQWAVQNNSFFVGSTGINNYNNITYETSNEIFTSNITILSGEAITSARLVYNNTIYSDVNVNLYSSELYILTKNLTIPLNSNAFANQTNPVYWSINYLSGSNQNLSLFNQTVRYINLQLCNSTFPTQYVNFTVLDEINQTAVNSTFQTTFSYYVSNGSGSIVKNYSINNLSQATNQYNLCFGPDNQSIIVSGTINFENTNYGPNEYSLSNANLNNNATQVNLYLIPLTVASKFYITVKQGVQFLTNNVVQVAKLFVGTNNYNTVSIRTTDDSGQFPMYMDIDAKYQFTVLEDGAVLGVVLRDATCATTPCSMIVNVPTDIGNVFEQYDTDYAKNILSNLSFNSTTDIVTYTFIDTTGLAQYFRLNVGKASYNTTAGGTICDTLVYSSSGSITCNVSGYTGDFYAYGYISRSPEKIDKFISFLIDDDVIESLGLFAILITIAVLLTGLFGAVTLSRGNPSTVLTTLAMLILLLKFAQIFPFSWTVVVALEAVIAFILFKLDS